MKTIIINLSDILKVNIEKSIQEFIKLRKDNMGRLCGLNAFAPTLFGVTDSAYVRGALFIANQGIIPRYRTGKMTTEKFISDCLRYHFPEPENYAKDWNNTLRDAWNVMLEIDEQKMTDFISILNANRETQFILITNSNDMHIDLMIKKFEFLGINLELNAEKNSFEDKNLMLYSSHKTGEFKTNGMIQRISKELKLEPRDTTVCTGYDNDLVFARTLKFNTVKISHNFDYGHIESYSNQNEHQHSKTV